MAITVKLNALQNTLRAVLGNIPHTLVFALDELTLEVSPADWLGVAALLRDSAGLDFQQCVDVCGMDYSTYQDDWNGKRFAAVYHLLSLNLNQRLRVRVFCEDDGFPLLDSVIDIWAGINWFEREAFDLYGIIFVGHPDLRRILTDYGFVGHPFRKDFPISGYVEMKFDAQAGRVIYQPVSIEPREVTPRIIREENYGG